MYLTDLKDYNTAVAMCWWLRQTVLHTVNLCTRPLPVDPLTIFLMQNPNAYKVNDSPLTERKMGHLIARVLHT